MIQRNLLLASLHDMLQYRCIAAQCLALCGREKTALNYESVPIENNKLARIVETHFARMYWKWLLILVIFTQAFSQKMHFW